MISLPHKSLHYLGYLLGALVVVYVVLMTMTFYFASSATELAGTARAQEVDIVLLEAKYYDAIEKLTQVNPESLGYVTPSRVVYVDALGGTALSRAGE